MSETATLEERYRAAEDTGERCELLRQLFRAYLQTDLPKAVAYADELGAVAAERQHEKGLAEWTLAQAMILDKRSEYDAAIEKFMEALQRFTQLNDRRGIAAVMINVGLIFFFRKEFEKAEAHYIEAIRIALAGNDEYILARGYANLANVYTTWKEYDKAVALYRKSLKLLNKLGDENGYARSLDNVGTLYRLLGQHKRAIRCHTRSYKIKLAQGDHENCARSLGGLGNIYCETKEYKKAISYFKKAVKLSSSLGAKEVEKAVYGSMSETYARMGDFKNAFICQQHYGRLKDKIVGEHSVQLYAEADARLKVAARELELEELRKALSEKDGFRELYEKGEQLPEGLEHLSKRELETYAELARGVTDKEIAARLFISVATVKTHLRRIYDKLDVKGRSEAIALANRHHLFG